MDTLRASELLQDAGLDPATAKAVVTVVHESVETAAATRLDLRNTEGRLNKKIDENFVTLDKKIDAKFTILDKKIDTVHGELKDEIADVRVELAKINGKIDSGLAEVRTEIAALNGKVDANHVQLNGKAGGDFENTVSMDCGDPAGVACVPGLQKRKRLRAGAHLAQEDAARCQA